MPNDKEWFDDIDSVELTMEDMDLIPPSTEEWIQAHREMFGDVTNFFSLRGRLNDKELIKAIEEAIQSNTPISDVEYGSEIPEGLDS